ncbi:MAG: FtsX-like permease family protein, partial [Asgard group archaeon]|nr:FtsX-like permease family protein [Asgard group archaeon]
ISYQKPAFILFLFILISIITSIVLALFGIFTARIIYHHRKRIVETKYRIGINRRQIILSFIIEIIAVSFMPILISTLIGFPILQFLDKFILTSSETYKIFSLSIPWWLIVSIFFIEFLLLFGGWYLTINQGIQRFKPIRQE